MSMMGILFPGDDRQDRAPLDACERCGAEIFIEAEAEPDETGHVLCPGCRWLEARRKGVGASDASCVLGLNPWKSNVQLWEEKTGRVNPPDISDKPVVLYGKTAEGYLRSLFALDFPEYSVAYDEFGMVAQPEHPWLFATLDGTLTDRETGRRGILEIKTTEIQRSMDWDKWNDRVPDYYYTQILHQLTAANAEFAVLKAQIKWRKGTELQITTRHYHFERGNCLEDMQYLLEREAEFWDCVCSDRRPALILPDI